MTLPRKISNKHSYDIISLLINSNFSTIRFDFLLASKYVTSLNSIRNMYIANNGEPGEANFKKGKSAEHLTVQVSSFKRKFL